MLGLQMIAGDAIQRVNPKCPLPMCLGLGMISYELALYARHGKELPYVAHHALGVAVLALALRSGQMAQYVAWAGLAEATNVPLGAISLLQASGRKGHWAYPLVGAALWLGFLSTRVVSLAWCCATMARDLAYDLPRAELDPALRLLLLPACFFIWALSCVWFARITQGMAKALGASAAAARPRRGEGVKPPAGRAA